MRSKRDEEARAMAGDSRKTNRSEAETRVTGWGRGGRRMVKSRVYSRAAVRKRLSDGKQISPSCGIFSPKRATNIIFFLDIFFI